VSTADLCIDPKLLEEKLSCIFRQAEHWNAILLLDEADVFMRERSLNHTDTHITTFLCTMEYYEGIMFLTTNRLRDFDPAMRSRVDLALSYPPLALKTRRVIWESFQQRAAKQGVMLSSNELDQLAEKKLDGRQVCAQGSHHQTSF
jgi:SpoVK/Ycf46/Vps4 family AAA+-type ATPase